MPVRELSVTNQTLFKGLRWDALSQKRHYQLRSDLLGGRAYSTKFKFYINIFQRQIVLVSFFIWIIG